MGIPEILTVAQLSFWPGFGSGLAILVPRNLPQSRSCLTVDAKRWNNDVPGHQKYLKLLHAAANFRKRPGDNDVTYSVGVQVTLGFLPSWVMGWGDGRVPTFWLLL